MSIYLNKRGLELIGQVLEYRVKVFKLKKFKCKEKRDEYEKYKNYKLNETKNDQSWIAP